MDGKYKVIGGVLLGVAAVLLAVRYLGHAHIAVFNPRGVVAAKERNLMVLVLSLMLLVVIPVFVMLFTFAWRYRESNTKATYRPDWDHNRAAETTWWLIPSALILVLSVVTWQATHQLDPAKPLVSKSPALTIQVVALDWKWLFIYPEQHIASVNFVQFPAGTPINFEITSDAPMNSFWIPQLGGQIYAMPGMSTQMHLMASSNGSYRGSSANISGKGFAGMKFVAKASSLSDFKTWVNNTKQSPQQLTDAAYVSLSAPSENNKPAYYSNSRPLLYDSIVTKYMSPGVQIGDAQ